MIVVQVASNDEWKSAITKHLSSTEIEQLTRTMQVEKGDVLLLCADRLSTARNVLGRLRTHCGNLAAARGVLTLAPDDFRFLWVVDFPLFSRIEADNVHEVSLVAKSVFQQDEASGQRKVAFTSTHHPFTAPVAEDEQLLDEIARDPSKLELAAHIRGQHYDVVVNGIELGGGSIRIHNAERQRNVFRKILRLPDRDVNASFHHLLEALDMGCPPHGGLALGFDRMVASTSGVLHTIMMPSMVTCE